VEHVGTVHLECHYGVDLASDGGPIGALCSALVDLGFGGAAKVLAYERDRGAVAVDLGEPATVQRVVVEKGSARGSTLQALEAGAPSPHPRRFGEVMLRGRHPRSWVGIRFDEHRPAMRSGQQWLFSNSVSFTTEKPRLGRTESPDWIRELLHRLAGGTELVWGAAWDDDEFRCSNLHDGNDGMWALGRDVRRSLPGLFWLNAFGPVYVELIGEDALMSAPGEISRLGSAVVMELYPSSDDWMTPTGREAHKRALTHLGRQYFYDRDAPERITVAPDFGLPELPASGAALQLLATEGETFTVLPSMDDA
jgi:hypothetical protein